MDQATLEPMSGIEWVSRNLIENQVKKAAEIGEWVREASSWEAWEPDEQMKAGARREKCG